MTVSFSNTAVANVPRIFTFSNSASPLPTEDILHPLTPAAKSAVSKIPSESIIKLLDVILSELNVNPPIVPLVAFNTPAVVTLNGASAKVASPSCIPSSASAMNIVSPLPKLMNLPAGLNVKFVAVMVSALIVSPPIAPAPAVTVPDMSTLPSLSKWKLELLISILLLLPLMN